MKKVIILTASTGAGHNAAAKSLEEKYKESGYETFIVDIFRETSKPLNTIVTDGYKILANSFPAFYGTLYDAADTYTFSNKILKTTLMVLKRRLLKIINQVEPDIIIGTHPFAVGLISSFKRKKLTDALFISVVTDFKAHYAYINENVDAYITGSEYTKETLINRNIDKNKIFNYGIPIKEEFLCKSENHDSVINKFRVLVMGGSMGSKDIAKVVENLAIDSDKFRITVICGNNNSLKNALEKKYEDEIILNKLKVYGFTSEVSYLMDNSDVIVTKPGGLTSSEALAKELPMIIPFAIPGQETENTEFLVNAGVAIHVKNMNKIRENLDELIDNKTKYINMKKSMKSISSSYSISNIVNLSDDLIINKNIALI
ncbi:MGDG synthase family glycosyltransferase [Helicovermis profundi]|uniref:Glycosyltransferase n=1 Tax=Helicovermis profundi TaxID=3065157 RepID=A0AAU9ELF4_9FIRM|nr:glycosyltransferase [Clostridia bacterium S502]